MFSIQNLIIWSFLLAVTVGQDNSLTYRHHHQDHGLYSGRSLMSAENSVKNRNKNEIEADKSSHLDAEELRYDPLKTHDYAEREWNNFFRYYDQMAHSTTYNFLNRINNETNILNDFIKRLPAACRRDLLHIRDSAQKHKLWALRLIDSIGKIPAGVTYGRFSSPGDYEECIAIAVDETIWRPKTKTEDYYKFRGKYCLLDMRLPLPERPADRVLSVHEPVVDLSNTNLAKEFPEIKNFSGYASALYEVGYLHAVCLPSSCAVEDIGKSLSKSLEGLYLMINTTIDCEQKFDEPKPLRKAQIISMTLITIVFLNAIIASLVHRYRQKQSNHNNVSNQQQPLTLGIPIKERPITGFQAWISSAGGKFYGECFSMQTNFERLTKPDPRGLTFVHYTRIVAMGLTVITHTGALGTLQAITKPADASNSEQIFRDFLPQMIANAFTSIQIFFFMAGFMLVVSTYPSIKRDRGKINFIEYALKRVIRLLPGLSATVAINFLWPLFVDGPMLTYFDRMIVEPCEKNWWRTMAFLSNFDHVEEMCLRHSYFSASDYQLHLAAFPLLILLYKQPALSLIISTILTIAGFAAQVIMVLTKRVVPFMMIDYLDKEAFFNVVHYIHHPSWNHMSAFFYGFIVGYMVAKQIRLELKPFTISLITYTVLPAGLLSIFAPYFWNHYKRPIMRWQMVLYVIFDRFALLSACAWLSYLTMVLARKPPRKEAITKTKETSPRQLGNFPDIVSIERGTLKKPEVLVTDSTSKHTLSPTSTDNLPRQRSTPNVSTYVKPGDVPQIQSFGKLTQSSSELNDQQTVESNQQAISQSDPEIDQQAIQKRREYRGHISNVNTLCLVLSRLTFQLYLFNMVVLWVDVNHSKYYWFFSYYFIIVKSFAVYICSTLLAMVFFVLLESPSLTLYIAWVKSRAQAEAKRLNRTLSDHEQQTKLSQNGTLARDGAKTDGRFAFAHHQADSVDSRKVGQDSLTKETSGVNSSPVDQDSVSANYDGLCIKIGKPSSGDGSPKSVLDINRLAFIDSMQTSVTPPSSRANTND